MAEDFVFHFARKTNGNADHTLSRTTIPFDHQNSVLLGCGGWVPTAAPGHAAAFPTSWQGIPAPSLHAPPASSEHVPLQAVMYFSAVFTSAPCPSQCFQGCAVFVTEPGFGCPLLKRPILKMWLLTGKELDLYSEGQQPGEKADACAKAKSNVAARPRDF